MCGFENVTTANQFRLKLLTIISFETDIPLELNNTDYSSYNDNKCITVK